MSIKMLGAFSLNLNLNPIREDESQFSDDEEMYSCIILDWNKQLKRFYEM